MRLQQIPALDLGRSVFGKVIYFMLNKNVCDVKQRSFIRPTVFAHSVKAIMNSVVTKLLVFIHPLYKILSMI